MFSGTVTEFSIDNHEWSPEMDRQRGEDHKRPWWVTAETNFWWQLWTNAGKWEQRVADHCRLRSNMVFKSNQIRKFKST